MILCVYFSSQLRDIQFVSRVVDLTSNPSLLDASALTVCGNLLFSRTINATQDSQVSSVGETKNRMYIIVSVYTGFAKYMCLLILLYRALL